MKFFILLAACCCSLWLHAQELFPFTEPASNMPSHSLSVKGTAMFEKNEHTNQNVQRYAPEIMFGLNKKWMVHVAGSFSNMYTSNVRPESVRLYAKYRFLSEDAVHKHFRMAAFVLGSYSRNPLHYDELNLFGDQSGIQSGLIATQLLNKFAVSGTVSLVEVLNGERWQKEFQNVLAWQEVNYSLSTGYLLFPLHYTNYKQTNINLYTEVLGSRNLGAPTNTYFVDVAPAIQAIFSSAGKLSFGYRFQISGDMVRMATNSFMISYEHIFLNALRKKK